MEIFLIFANLLAVFVATLSGLIFLASAYLWWKVPIGMIAITWLISAYWTGNFL